MLYTAVQFVVLWTSLEVHHFQIILEVMHLMVPPSRFELETSPIRMERSITWATNGKNFEVKTSNEVHNTFECVLRIYA